MLGNFSLLSYVIEILRLCSNENEDFKYSNNREIVRLKNAFESLLKYCAAAFFHGTRKISIDIHIA